ncbi:MAG: hypothetical protein WKF75_07965 [Singulisphaera sp.]
MTITGGHPAALGVAMVAPEAHATALAWCSTPVPRGLRSARRPGRRLLVAGLARLDRAGAGAGQPGPAATVQVGSVRLTELAGVPAVSVAVARPRPARVLGLRLEGPHALDRFGGGGGPGPADLLATAHNLTRYMAHCGASAVVLPEGLADRSRRGALDGQAAEDAVGPDRLDLLLRILGRHGCSAWLEPALTGPLPGLPPPDSAEALARGLVRVDRRGQADGPAYHPLHPEVAEALKRRVAEALAPRRGGAEPDRPARPARPRPDAAGRARHRPRRRHVRPVRPRDLRGGDRAGGARAGDDRPGPVRHSGAIPGGLGPDALVDLALSGDRRAVRRARQDRPKRGARGGPGGGDPGLDDGPAGAEARRGPGRAGPQLCLAAVGLDLQAWPGARGPHRPAGRRPPTDDLPHDLATSPDLDAHAARPARGCCWGRR